MIILVQVLAAVLLLLTFSGECHVCVPSGFFAVVEGFVSAWLCAAIFV
jgi:hypothetical protein